MTASRIFSWTFTRTVGSTRATMRAVADLEVEQDLGAERLDHLDHRVEDVLRRIGAGRHVEVLRPDAQRDRLALVRPAARPARAGGTSSSKPRRLGDTGRRWPR